MSDPISDMLTRIRNAAQAALPIAEIPHSKVKEGIAVILKKEGYIADFGITGEKIKTLTVKLKYDGRTPVIEGLKRISRPGLRRYTGGAEVPKVRGGLGVAIVSTSQGLMTGIQARRANIGGELLCFIW